MAEYSDQTLKELGQLMLKARKNPKTSKGIARIVQTIDSSVKFPDLEIDDVRAEMNQRFEQAEIERDRQATLNQLAAQRRRVANMFDGDETVMGKIESLMKKHQIFDYDVGRKLYAADQPAPQPRQEPFMGANWEAPNIKELLTNPLAYERNEARKAIDEINAAKRDFH